MEEIVKSGEVFSQRTELGQVLDRAGRESWGIFAGIPPKEMSGAEAEFLKPITPLDDMREVSSRGPIVQEENLVKILNDQAREELRRGMPESGHVPVDKFLEREKTGEFDPDRLAVKLGIRRDDIPTTFEGASHFCGPEFHEVAVYLHEKYKLGPTEAAHVTEDPECAAEMIGLMADLYDYRVALTSGIRGENDPKRSVELAILELELANRIKERVEKIGAKIGEARQGRLSTGLATEHGREERQFREILGRDLIEPWNKVHSELEARLRGPMGR